MFLQNHLIKRGKSIQSTDSDKKIKELETQLSEQTKAIETVKKRSKNITNVAKFII